MKSAKFSAFVLALACAPVIVSGAQDYPDAKITVDAGAEKTPISPYIYGINDGIDASSVCAGAIRQGGNRYTAYNWETNYSNAGSDWYFSSDTYLSDSDTPGDCAVGLSQIAQENSIDYKIVTLQMAGYVSADKSGSVSEDEAAPSLRWNAVEYAKNAEFSLEPDLTDGVVYMDEYVNYLVNTLGDSKSENGINGYNLDNEPALWSATHALCHAQPVTCSELIDRSSELAAAVKNVDENAEIFAPALYGFNAYITLQDAPDWQDLDNSYDMFIGYYLDRMKEESEEKGIRLLDVLDLHYYSEAMGDCRVTSCSDLSHTSCIEARMQAVRTLWDESYTENSWIGQYFSRYLPIIPVVNEQIDTYYPGTKLSFTEYNFGGGNHISGAVAEFDALGVFGQQGVYLAALWPLETESTFALSAIDLYTNFDSNGSKFGDLSIDAVSSDIEKCTAYASLDSADDSRLTVGFSTKDMQSDAFSTEISIENSNQQYSYANIYSINPETASIDFIGKQTITDNSFSVETAGVSVCMAEIFSEQTDLSEGDVSQAESSPISYSDSEKSDESKPEKSGFAPLAVFTLAFAALLAAASLVMITRKKS